MRRSPRAVLAALTTAIMLTPACASAQQRVRLPADYSAWQRVAQCESGGWRVLGSRYPDPFGITAHNWAYAGGNAMPVGAVTLRARVVAIQVADRFRAEYGIPIPDQHGCAAW
jgi:hypothetical protein